MVIFDGFLVLNYGRVELAFVLSLQLLLDAWNIYSLAYVLGSAKPFVGTSTLEKFFLFFESHPSVLRLPSQRMLCWDLKSENLTPREGELCFDISGVNAAGSLSGLLNPALLLI